MLWVQEIPSYRFLTPNSEKIENRQDRRITRYQVYKIKNKERKKAYILLFARSVTKAVHLELLPSQTAEEFIKHGRFIRITGEILSPPRSG